MEKRKRRASGVVFARRSASSRIRYLQIDPDPLGRSPALSCHLSLSLTPSAGIRGPDCRALGGKSGAAPPSILQPHAEWQQDSSLKTKKLEGFRGGHQPHNG